MPHNSPVKYETVNMSDRIDRIYMILGDAHDFMRFSPQARSLTEHGEKRYA
jgi:hypothetical protein